MNDDVKRFAHEAMATTFEVIVAGETAEYAQQAAAAVFAEVDEIERALSRFIDTSDISQINHLSPGPWAKIGDYTFECLKAAARVHAETNGAFDPTIGPLMKCWRNPDKSMRHPSDAELAEARARVGMSLIELDEGGRRVRVKKEGVQLDLGGIGKGYACDRGREVLKDWSVKTALVNGGDSSALAIGAPPGKDGWPVGVGGVGGEHPAPFTLYLRDRSLSGSGMSAKGRHIMNPHTGRPIEDKDAAWSLHPSAAVADGLSTAFTVMTPEEVERYCRDHPDTSAMLAVNTPEGRRLLRFGDWPGLVKEATDAKHD